MCNFVLSVRDDIISSFKKIEPKYFDLLNNLSEPIGKGVRSRFTFKLSRALKIDYNRAVKIASSAELVHIASLLHDDCIDEAITRRGIESVNFKFGVNKAILVGDLVASLSFEKARSLSPDMALALVDCVKDMTKGALLEENLKYKIISEKDYFEIVNYKTSALFKWISFALASFSKSNNFISLEKISNNFGLGFQIIDDIIDIEENENVAGKDTFKDLLEGKVTYPVIISLKDDYVKEKINGFFSDRDVSKLYEIKRYLIDNGYTLKARERTKNIILELRDDVLKISKEEAGIDFFNYIYSITERKK